MVSPVLTNPPIPETLSRPFAPLTHQKRASRGESVNYAVTPQAGSSSQACRYLPRRDFLSTLPTLVLSMASMKRTLVSSTCLEMMPVSVYS